MRCLCGDVINLCLRSIVPCRKCSKKKVKLRLKNVTILHLRPIIPGRKCLKKKVNVRFKKHLSIHKVHTSLQKVLEKEGKAKIEKCNHPTPQVPQFLSEAELHMCRLLLYYGWRVIRGLDRNRGRRAFKFDHVGT